MGSLHPSSWPLSQLLGYPPAFQGHPTGLWRAVSIQALGPHLGAQYFPWEQPWGSRPATTGHRGPFHAERVHSPSL